MKDISRSAGAAPALVVVLVGGLPEEEPVEVGVVNTESESVAVAPGPVAVVVFAIAVILWV